MKLKIGHCISYRKRSNLRTSFIRQFCMWHWLVSVLITTHNSAEFIAYTLESVFWQTYTHIEILIVDNNSSDTTRDIIQRYVNQDKRITLYSSPKNLGAYWGLNYLLEKSVGDYIAIIDHDDIWHPEKLGIQASFLEAHTECIWCGSAFLDVREGTYFCKYELHTIKNVVLHSSLMFRNKWYRYNAHLERYSDRDMMVHTLAKDGTIHHLDDILVLRRIRRGARNFSVKEASLMWMLQSKKTSGVPAYEYVYNFFRFRYGMLYRFLLHIFFAKKITSLTDYLKKPLWNKYKDFIIQAFA